MLESVDLISHKQAELAELLDRFSGEDGIHSTAIPSLYCIRSSNVTEPIYRVHEPALCIIAQGAKELILAQESYRYGPSDYLVVSVDLPVSGQIIEASSEAPYLCLRLDFEPNQVVEIIEESGLGTGTTGETKRGLFVSQTNSSLLDAVIRLVRLLETPEDVPALAPLVIREILYRILKGQQGDALKQIAMTGSSAYRIVKVIERIKRNYDQSLRIEELAELVNMSASSLHRHFKDVTAMSPLQYQKQIRLQEARRLLLSESADAADVGFRVGYESPSQFSREYARMFGLPPIGDMKRLRMSGEQQSV
ncbi:Helix-turn-helix domain-containing protein [Paenibacillus sophorae]|uniref:AraC family transcriptional regulator n=1 Tax=Paenibacillus sophorae TaxID=1333845 RepID=A0A1H8SBT1_9BACL|nr:AraC family transcriptional regulator [Paenibacillus sophorae]QWU16783.1 AraC family transcriptional regulator [Paenibacillus sophorae]SEO76112.1 Helix-turn-helix domain-containing protein [Paenibacillus sophorae]